MIVYSLCPKITISGEAGGSDRMEQYIYEQAVNRVLNTIAKTRVGKTMFDEINLRSHAITIIPTRVTETRDAGTSPVLPPGNPIAIAARSPKEQPVLVRDLSTLGVCKDVPLTHNNKIVRGTGAGTDESIEFTPRHWIGMGNKATADCVLVHELTHALRANMGLIQGKQTCNDYLNEEEFFAILIENLYRSELNKNGESLILRWHHHGAVEMPPKLADPAFFFQFHKEKIVRMQHEMPHFVTTLMDIRDIAFNPFTSKSRIGQ